MLFRVSNVLRFQASLQLQALGKGKKAIQVKVSRTRMLEAAKLKEKRRELVDQGVLVDSLVARAYQELKEEGWVLPEVEEARARAANAAAAAAAAAVTDAAAAAPTRTST